MWFSADFWEGMAAPAELSPATLHFSPQQVASPTNAVLKPETQSATQSEQRSIRRNAIVHQFQSLGSPVSRSDWGGVNGVVAKICNTLPSLQKAKGNTRSYVFRVLDRHVQGLPLALHGGGRKRKLTDGEAAVAADCLERGLGRQQAAFEVSNWREKKGMSQDDAAVSYKAVRTGFRSLGGVTQKRSTEQTGSRDTTSPWSTSRLAQCLQFKQQLVLPDDEPTAGEKFKVVGKRALVTSLSDDPLKLISSGSSLLVPGSWWPNQPAAVQKKKWVCNIVGYVEKFRHANAEQTPVYLFEHLGLIYPIRTSDAHTLLPPAQRPSYNSTNLPKIPLLSIVWTDEKHKAVSLGSYASKWEHRVPRDPSGKPAACGTLPPRRARTKAKYASDGGRFGMGVMVKRGADGKLEGHRIQPFNYSHGYICGPKTYRSREIQEIARVANFERAGWGKLGLGVTSPTVALPGGRYQLRYPDTWRAVLRVECAKCHDGLKGYICVTEMMDWLVPEFKRVFEDTPYADTFVIYHDALKEWWEPAAQQHLLEKHGISSARQMCCKGDTNLKVAAHYRGKLVGDSPELMPLDNNLFADFENAMSHNIAHTADLPHGHPEKFLVGTPAEVQRTMLRTWEMAPTSVRIVEDVLRFPASLDAIIAAKGAKVEKLGKRKGRRSRKRFLPPSCPEAEEHTLTKYRRLDPVA